MSAIITTAVQGTVVYEGQMFDLQCYEPCVSDALHMLTMVNIDVRQTGESGRDSYRDLHAMAVLGYMKQYHPNWDRELTNDEINAFVGAVAKHMALIWEIHIDKESYDEALLQFHRMFDDPWDDYHDPMPYEYRFDDEQANDEFNDMLFAYEYDEDHGYNPDAVPYEEHIDDDLTNPKL